MRGVMSNKSKTPSKPRLEVTKESQTGRNERFLDRKTGEELTRSETVKKIEKGEIPGYHIRKVNDLKTPVSNPNKKTSDNLG